MAETVGERQLPEPLVIFSVEDTTPVTVTLTTAGTAVNATDELALLTPTPLSEGFTLDNNLDPTLSAIYTDYDGPCLVEVHATIAATQIGGAIQTMQLLLDGVVVDEDHRVMAAAADTMKLVCAYNFEGATPVDAFDGRKIQVAFVGDTNADTAEVYKLQVICRRYPAVFGTGA
jgi:hypothetical protein